MSMYLDVLSFKSVNPPLKHFVRNVLYYYKIHFFELILASCMLVYYQPIYIV